MNVKEIISHIIDIWFIYEPLLFNVYCTHKLEENKDMKVFFRTGKKKIQYNPVLLENICEKEMEVLLKIEVTRIILKHPYQRMPRYPNRSALTVASDITISEHCFSIKCLKNAEYYNFENKLSYEEYYRDLYHICNNNCTDLKNSSEETYEQIAANASELWDEDEGICDSINQQIEKAQKTNQWGSISGNFQETITASMKIPMDYRRILSQLRANIISHKRKLTRMKPNRRYGFEFLGSKFEPKTKLLVAVDSSGSIGTDDLQHFFSIINRIFSYGVESIQVVVFDKEIKQKFELTKAAKKIEISGRGGTDFQCAIDYYENHSEYNGMILFTDGYAKVPVIKKHKQIVWIFTGKQEYENGYRWIKSLRGSKATWIPSVKKNN